MWKIIDKLSALNKGSSAEQSVMSKTKIMRAFSFLTRTDCNMKWNDLLEAFDVPVWARRLLVSVFFLNPLSNKWFCMWHGYFAGIWNSKLKFTVQLLEIWNGKISFSCDRPKEFRNESNGSHWCWTEIFRIQNGFLVSFIFFPSSPKFGTGKPST